MELHRARRRALLAVLSGGAILSTALQRALAQTVAQGVRGIQGEVLVNGKTAARGTPVRPGDTVTTGK
ncbi:MAG TPA: hypothetical protein VIW78_15550, partial [Burkholderiales bacterium]